MSRMIREFGSEKVNQMKHWILINGNIQEATLEEWAEWFENPDLRRIDRTEINDDVYVSTVFMGLDHRFEEGQALLFETMVFGGKYDETQERYSTLGEAKCGHYRIVEQLRNEINGETENAGI